jgi:hypothetical protein
MTIMSIQKRNDETLQPTLTLTTKPLRVRSRYMEGKEEELRVILIFGQNLLCDRKIRGTKETRRL